MRKTRRSQGRKHVPHVHAFTGETWTVKTDPSWKVQVCSDCLKRKDWHKNNQNIYDIYIYTRDYTRSPVVTMGWFGVGWGGDDDVPCTWTHLWWVGMVTFLAHEHIFDATEMMTFLAHEHIFDATEMMSFLAHDHIFTAAALHRKPGIMSVLNALQLYRNDCSSGKICVAPKDAFDPDSLSWLA